MRPFKFAKQRAPAVPPKSPTSPEGAFRQRALPRWLISVAPRRLPLAKISAAFICYKVLMQRLRLENMIGIIPLSSTGIVGEGLLDHARRRVARSFEDP